MYAPATPAFDGPPIRIRIRETDSPRPDSRLDPASPATVAASETTRVPYRSLRSKYGVPAAFFAEVGTPDRRSKAAFDRTNRSFHRIEARVRR
jgi:hypothetical protein